MRGLDGLKSFVHEDPDFRDLVAIVAEAVGIAPAFVEKDYWVTHTLWALHQVGLEIWFKGGTSLFKGFGLIERFSEDVDVRIEPGTANVPSVRSWHSLHKGPVAERRAFYEALEGVVAVPQAALALDRASLDRDARGACYRVQYPGLYLADLAPTVRPFVLVEAGIARVTPFVVRPLSSFVHDWLRNSGQESSFAGNRPDEVRCVHPLVTLLDKVDAIGRRYAREPMAPETFVRHYEDAARIVERSGELPPLGLEVAALATEMRAARQIAAMPSASESWLLLSDLERRRLLLTAHQAISPMFWGSRRSLEDCCDIIQAWLVKELG